MQRTDLLGNEPLCCWVQLEMGGKKSQQTLDTALLSDFISSTSHISLFAKKEYYKIGMDRLEKNNETPSEFFFWFCYFCSRGWSDSLAGRPTGRAQDRLVAKSSSLHRFWLKMWLNQLHLMANTMEIQYLPPGCYSSVPALHPGSLSVHPAEIGSLHLIKPHFEGTSTSLIREAATI